MWAANQARAFFSDDVIRLTWTRAADWKELSGMIYGRAMIVQQLEVAKLAAPEKTPLRGCEFPGGAFARADAHA
jgi:hypothetical protein